MTSASRLRLTFLTCLLAVPTLTFASSICVTGGSCPAVDTLSSGASTSGAFDLSYSAPDGDLYSVVGNYSASNPSSGDTSIVINAAATYEGNGGVNSIPSVGADTFTLTDLQDYDLSMSSYYMTYGSLDGTYSESANSASIGMPSAGSSWDAQLSYNGQALPVLGPFTGSGYAANSAALTGFGSTTTLAADYVLTYDFAAGTAPGSGFATTPEPGGLIPLVGILALCLGAGVVRRSRLAKNLG